MLLNPVAPVGIGLHEILIYFYIDDEHLHYNDRLEHLGLNGLMCLHTRKIRSDLIDTYKIINGIYKC